MSLQIFLVHGETWRKADGVPAHTTRATIIADGSASLTASGPSGPAASGDMRSAEEERVSQLRARLTALPLAEVVVAGVHQEDDAAVARSAECRVRWTLARATA
jgi:hypothetical protein